MMSLRRLGGPSSFSVLLLLYSVGLYAQDSNAPLIVTQQAPIAVNPTIQPTGFIPQNTEILLELNDTITTKGKRWNEGDNFGLTVTRDVVLGDRIAIPRGSRGVGRVTWLTDKGAFGKSGKLEIDLEYVEVRGQRIPISGSNRKEGGGNAAATVGGVLLVGLFAGFITGRSGSIPQGTQMVARTKDDYPVNLETLPLTKQAQLRLEEEKTQRKVSNSVGGRRVKCMTCR